MPFINCFFSLYIPTYNADLTAEAHLLFPFDATTIIPFKVQYRLEPHYTATEKVIVHLNGIAEGKEPMENPSLFNARYTLYPEDHSIHSIIGEVFCGITKQTMEFGIYHLNPERRDPKRVSVLIREENPNAITDFNKKYKTLIGAEKPKEIQGFWRFLNKL